MADEQLRFAEALDQAQQLRKRTDAAERRRSETVERRRAVVEEINEVRAKQDGAEADEAAARAALDSYHAAVRAAEAAAQIGALKERLAQAEAARQTLEEAEAALAQARAPDGAVDELVELDVQIASERARREAERPSVTIFYEAGATARITLGDDELPDGEARSYGGAASLRAPGIGTVELRANYADDDKSRIPSLETRRSTLLALMGVTDLSGARAQQERAQQLSAEVREARAQLALLAPDGLPKLREEVAGLAVAEGEAPSVKANADELQAALDDASALRKLKGQELREIESRRVVADNDYMAGARPCATPAARSNYSTKG